MNSNKRKLIIIALIVLMLISSIGATPLIWTISVKKRIVEQINNWHGNKYAIIGLNVNHEDVRETFHFSMYERIYSYVRFKWGTNTVFNAWHHCAILVSDNEKMYRYYWSIRENTLVLDQTKAIPDSHTTTYHYNETDIENKHGMRFKSHVADRDIWWYF